MTKTNRMKNLFFTLTLLFGFLSPYVAASCQDGYWPVYAGGATGSEDVRCFIYDPSNKLIIVGGVTNSEDFAPAPNDHGFLYALDLSGNWMWGNFYYNVSYAIAQINDCQLSSDGSSLAIAGLGNDLPIMMDINTKDGTLNRFLSLDLVNGSSNQVPAYSKTQAIHYDKRDYRDNLPYFYTSFNKNGDFFLLRVVDT